MGLFNKKKKTTPNSKAIDSVAIIEKHAKRQLDDQAFLLAFSQATVYNSTPFGDHVDGGQRPFVLPDEGNAVFLPIFTSTDRAKEFFDKSGRNGFLLMEGTFMQIIETTIKINSGNEQIQFGLVIDPGYNGITVKASILKNVLNMLQGG